MIDVNALETALEETEALRVKLTDLIGQAQAALEDVETRCEELRCSAVEHGVGDLRNIFRPR